MQCHHELKTCGSTTRTSEPSAQQSRQQWSQWSGLSCDISSVQVFRNWRIWTTYTYTMDFGALEKILLYYYYCSFSIASCHQLLCLPSPHTGKSEHVNMTTCQPTPREIHMNAAGPARIDPTTAQQMSQHLWHQQCSAISFLRHDVYTNTIMI